MRELTSNEVQEINGGAVVVGLLVIIAVGSIIGAAGYAYYKRNYAQPT